MPDSIEAVEFAYTLLKELADRRRPNDRSPKQHD